MTKPHVELTALQVFINPLRTASPPVIAPERLPGFLSEVFWNLRDILAHHQRMLAALFARQREQHPLVQSVADIILDSESCCYIFNNQAIDKTQPP